MRVRMSGILLRIKERTRNVWWGVVGVVGWWGLIVVARASKAASTNSDTIAGVSLL